jgi:hypothetical protein
MTKDEKGKGEKKEGLGSFRMRYRLAVFRCLLLADQPAFIFVTVNKARRHCASSALSLTFSTNLNMYVLFPVVYVTAM